MENIVHKDWLVAKGNNISTSAKNWIQSLSTHANIEFGAMIGDKSRLFRAHVISSTSISYIKWGVVEAGMLCAGGSESNTTNT